MLKAKSTLYQFTLHLFSFCAKINITKLLIAYSHTYILKEHKALKDKPYISRKEQAVLTKKKIFDTTLLLIKKKGYNKITIREICQHAEISVGTFYIYFLSKDDILLDIYQRLDNDLPEHYKPDSSSSAEQELSRLMNCFFNLLGNSFDKDLIREIYRINLSFEKEPLFSKDTYFYKMLIQIAENARTKGILKDLSPELFIKRILIFVWGYLFHWLIDEESELSAAKDDCLLELSQYIKLYLEPQP